MSKFKRTWRKNRLFCKKPVFKKAQELLSAATQALGYSLLLSHLTFIPYVYAGPTGANVVGGNGHVHYNGNVTDIHQVSSRLAIDWASYNIKRNEVVNYLQPGVNSIALNHILDISASQIRGQINSNGQVILVNPNGIFFGSDASVNVGGLIASGLDISPADFMNGNYIFKSVDGTSGAVVNGGLLNASLGGSITLLGKQVINTGLISANLGAVNLAAGREAILTFDAAGLVGVRISKEILQNELGLDPAILNSGEVTAESGRVLLTASQSQDIFSRAVNSNGIEQATSAVVNADGTFTLGAGADVINSGSINVSSLNESDAGQVVLLGENINSSGVIKADALKANGGDIELHANNTTTLTGNSLTTARAEANGSGGIVKVLGNKVGVAGNSQLDVSGAQGGGSILIGGDYQGRNVRIRNAQRTYIGKNVSLNANALYRGNGGKIINWSDSSTWFYGSAFAQGGSESGNGGLVEISGKALNFNGYVSTTAVNGALGVLLFDPTNIFIHDQAVVAPANDAALPVINAGDGSGTEFHIGERALELLSAGSNILLEATNNITINNLADDVLALELDDNSGGSIVFTANSGNAGGGGFFMHASDTIKTKGGSVTISGASVAIGSIDTQGGPANTNNDGLNGGNITITSDTTLAVTGVINANGGDGGGNGGNTGGDAGNIFIQAGTDISTTAVSSNGGKSDGSKTAGNAGTIDIISTAGNLTASGDITATGGLPNGSGNNAGGAKIDLQATSGIMTLQGNINAEGFTNAGITINAQTLKLNGAAAQLIRGSKIDITSTNALQLLQNLSINSAAGSGVAATNTTDVILNANVDYNGIGATGSLVIGAGNDIILNGNMTDSVVDTDQLSVTLNSNNDGGTNGDIAINGSIATNNALFSATGTNYDARSTAGSKYTINTGTAGATLLMTGDVDLGEMVVGAVLDVSSGGYIAQGSANAIDDALTITGVTKLSAVNNITLNNATNNFSNVSITTANNVNLIDIDSIILNASIVTGTLDVTALSTGAISQAGKLVVSGASVFTAVDSSITLADVTNDFSSVGVNALNVTLLDANNIALDTSSVTGALNVTASGTGSITQGTGGVDVTGVATLTAGDNIALTGTANDFSNVALTATNNVALIDSNSVVLNASTAGSMDITALSNGTITQAGKLAVTGTANFVAVGNDITLGDVTNALTTVGVNGANVIIQDGDSLDFVASMVTGALTATVNGTGVITQSGALDVAGITTLTAVANNITLNNSANDFSTVVVTGNTVGLTDSNNIDMGASSVTGTLNITANGGGNITQSGALIVTGGTTLTALGNNITLADIDNNFSTVSVNAANVRLQDVNDIALGTSVVTGTLDVTANGAGNITQNGVLDVSGLSTFTALNNNITLTRAANDFSTVKLSAANVNLTDANNIDLAASTLSGGLRVTAQGTGSISQSGKLDVAGVSTFTATGGNIVLTDSTNAFSTVRSNAVNATLVDVDSIDLGVSAITGDFNVTANNAGVITQSGALAVTGITTLAATGNDITLENTANNFSTVNLSGANVSIVDADDIIIGASPISGTFDVSVFGIGDITQSSSMDVAGAASFKVNAGRSIVLNDNLNGFQGGVSFAANTVGNLLDVLVSNNAALDLGTITVDRHLGVVANGNVTNSGVLTVGNVAFIEAAGNSITLDNPSNNFNNVIFNNASSVTIADINSINIGAADTTPYTVGTNSNITGNLNVTTLSGNITDNDSSLLTVGGVTTLSAGTNISPGDINLNAITNDFNRVDIANARNVTLVDSNSIDLSSTIISGNMAVTSGGNITNGVAALNVSGTSSFTANTAGSVLLNNAANQLAGALTFAASSGNLSNVNVVNARATNFQALTLDNNLTVSSAGAIRQNGAFDVANLTTLTAVNGSAVPQNITLNSANNLNQLVINSANVVNVSNATNPLIINSLNASGAVTINSGSLVSGGTIAGSGVTLNSGANIMSLNNVNSGGVVSLSSLGLIASGDIVGAGVLINSATGASSLNNISSTGAVDVSATGLMVSGNVSGSSVTMDSTTAAMNVNNINSVSTVNLTGVGIMATGDLAGTGITLDAGNGAVSLNSVTATGKLTTTSVGFINNGVVSVDNVSIDSGTGSSNLTGDITSVRAIKVDATGIAVNGVLNSIGETRLDGGSGGVIIAQTVSTSLGNLVVIGNDIVQSANISAGGKFLVLSATNTVTQNADITAVTDTSNVLVFGDNGITMLNGTTTSGSFVLYDSTVGTGDINIANINTNSISGTDDAIVIDSSGSVIQNGNIRSERGGVLITSVDSFTMNSGAAVNVINGGLVIDSGTGMNLAAVTSEADITLTSQANSIVFNAGVDSTNGNVIATAQQDIVVNAELLAKDNLNLTAVNGRFTQAANLTASQGDVIVNSGQDINMASDTSTTSTTGNIQYSAVNDVGVTLFTAAGIAGVETTTGAIIDANSGANNFTANTLLLRAATGIGSIDAIETQTRSMDVINTGSGSVELSQTGVVDLVALRNTGVDGDITLQTDKDINLNPGSVVANRDTGILQMRTQTGNILGLGAADITNPDITAESAIFIALAGTFGTFQRPITPDINVNGSVLISTRASFDPQFAPPKPSDVTITGIDFSALSAISAVAGEQLVEVESLGDIDPAIFTNLQNYSLEETSIRLPRDQLFDDELEVYDRL